MIGGLLSVGIFFGLFLSGVVLGVSPVHAQWSVPGGKTWLDEDVRSWKKRYDRPSDNQPPRGGGNTLPSTNPAVETPPPAPTRMQGPNRDVPPPAAATPAPKRKQTVTPPPPKRPPQSSVTTPPNVSGGTTAPTAQELRYRKWLEQQRKKDDDF